MRSMCSIYASINVISPPSPYGANDSHYPPMRQMYGKESAPIGGNLITSQDESPALEQNQNERLEGF